MSANTLFLRLEGPLQAWGNQESKFVVRRTADAPTKSGVIGMLCAALGVSRPAAAPEWIGKSGKLCALRMGVRIDQPGVRWWDYHTVGAHMQMRTAEGRPKAGAMLTRREYLCDASFLVALQGEPTLVAQLEAALRKPCWTPYLGRKACPPSRPLLERPAEESGDLLTALCSVPWRPRLRGDQPGPILECLLDWQPSLEEPVAPAGALVAYDVPLTFEPPAHDPRFVVRRRLRVGEGGEVSIAEKPAQSSTPAPPRPRADYKNTEYQKKRDARWGKDHYLCVFCKAPLTPRTRTVQHVTYRRAGGDETLDDLRSLCRLCHDAVTMIEYGLGMGLDRINPEDSSYRERIIEKRREIIQFRSLETRRRRLSPEEVE
ncbi:MAG: type I-E CRISPR-associated protein Cas5/CasD [Chloroflexi bacterium]|nr:type I-E CRISPR-associated protein Cas5/CasD [Chloroflexota bacterium]